MKPLIHWTALGLIVAGCVGGGGDVITPPPAEVAVDPSMTIEPLFASVPLGFTNEEIRGGLSVRVRRNGVVAQGVAVFWGVDEGKIVPTTTLTDVFGVARDSIWTLGNTVGTQTAWAALGANGTRVTFEARVRSRELPAARLNLNSCLAPQGGHRWEPPKSLAHGPARRMRYAQQTRPARPSRG